jgi:hypothetical protein
VWLCGQITSHGPSPAEAIAAWQRWIASDKEETMADLRASGLSARQAAVATLFATGWRVWCRYIVDTLGEDQVGVATAGVLTVSDLAHRHAKVVMAPEEFGSASVVDRLRQALVSGRAWIDGMTAPADARTSRLIGRLTTVNKSRMVALIPEDAGGVLGIKGSQVVNELTHVLVPDRTGRSRRNVRFSNGTSRCVVIPYEAWFNDSETDALASAPVPKDTDDEDF